MGKKLFKSILLLMASFVAMIFIALRFYDIIGLLGKLIMEIAPLLIGAALLLVLIRPYKFLLRIYQKALRRKPKLTRAAKPLAVISVYLGFALFIALVLLVLIPQIKESAELFYSNINIYIKRLESLANSLLSYIDSDIDISYFEEMLSDIPKNLPEWISSAASYVVPGIFNFTSGFISALFNFVIGLVFSIYLLCSKDTLKAHFRILLERYIKEKKTAGIMSFCRQTFNTFTGFIWGQFTEAVILGCLCFIGMLIFRFQYPILISVLIALTSVIPVVGGFIGAIPSILILLMVQPVQAFWFAVFIILLQQLESNLIYPYVMGDNIGMPGIWVLVAVIIGGGLFGVWGMLIGVPTAAVAYKMIWKDIGKRKPNNPQYSDKAEKTNNA